MNIWRMVLTELHLWRHYPSFRIRWLLWYRYNSLGLKKFRLGGVEYPYFLHPYNLTWSNERAVEISVIYPLMKSSDPASTLEIGNVMSHYFDSDHMVVDKNENCSYRPVINEDLVEFNPQRKFKLIVSISTIEHVGWDDCPRDESKIIEAIKKIRALIEPGGKAVITAPIGYNSFLDSRMLEVVGQGATLSCLKRISEDNQWIETDLYDALRCSYNSPYKYANAVVFIYLSGYPGFTDQRVDI